MRSITPAADLVVVVPAAVLARDLRAAQDATAAADAAAAAALELERAEAVHREAEARDRREQDVAQERARAASTAAAASAAMEEEDASCVVCMEAERSHLFAPCGHLCVCEMCAALVMSGDTKCPMCRVPATQILKVFT